MIAASFQFQQFSRGGDFEKLDSQIMAYCAEISGYLGKKSWVSDDTRNVIYYFESREALAELGKFEPHIEAKRRNREWYQSHRVEIYEIISSYGSELSLENAS